MNKESRTLLITGIIMIFIGIVAWIPVQQIGQGVISIASIITGLILGYYSYKKLANTTETGNIAEPQNPKRQIVITISDYGTVEIVAEGIPFNEAIAILEVSKYQLINQFTEGGQSPVQLIKRP